MSLICLFGPCAFVRHRNGRIERVGVNLILNLWDLRSMFIWQFCGHGLNKGDERRQVIPFKKRVKEFLS